VTSPGNVSKTSKCEQDIAENCEASNKANISRLEFRATCVPKDVERGKDDMPCMKLLVVVDG